MSAHALQIEAVEKHYGALPVLKGIDLTVAGGEFLTLLGPSGSGKTTLLMTIAGFVTPTRGTLLLDGRDITGLPPEKRDFGMVFQGYALFPNLSVADNVGFPLRVRGLPRAAVREKVTRALDLVQLGHLGDRMPKQLSGGQQQRVALARALVFDPAMLLLDEPLSALDKSLRADLQWELKALHERVGVTFIYVTHDQEEALSMSDRIAILRDGQLAQVGAPGALYETPATRFVADFLGKSNFLSGQITDSGTGNQGCQIGAHRFVCSDLAASVGDKVLLSLRPEKIEISETPPVGAVNAVPARLTGWNYYGTSFQYRVAADGLPEEMVVINKAFGRHFEPRHDLPVWLSWRADAVTRVEDI